MPLKHCGNGCADGCILDPAYVPDRSHFAEDGRIRAVRCAYCHAEIHHHNKFLQPHVLPTFSFEVVATACMSTVPVFICACTLMITTKLPASRFERKSEGLFAFEKVSERPPKIFRSTWMLPV